MRKPVEVRHVPAQTQRCPECDAELPPELGQHALSPSAGVVQCPSCGAHVALAGSQRATDTPDTRAAVPRAPERPGGEEGAGEYFSGEESVEGVMDEVREKQEG
jgi:hypothetical protein